MVSETYCFCRQCDARVEIGRVRVGTILVCPICGFEFATSRRPHEDRTTDEETVIVEPPPAYRTISEALSVRFVASVASRTMLTALVAVAPIAALRLAAWCVLFDGVAVERTTRVLLWSGLLWSAAIGIFAIPVFLLVASAYGLAILRETSEGCETVVRWPRLLVLEGREDVGYVVVALFCSATPGICGGLVGGTTVALTATVGAMAVLFPIFLLSSLNAESPVTIFSSVVWRSMLWAWRGWVLFYVATFAVATLFVGARWLVVDYLSWAWDVILCGVVVACVWMAYCRLLGRLSWYCSTFFAKSEDEAAARAKGVKTPMTHFVERPQTTRLDEGH
jgi:hypothetical protein